MQVIAAISVFFVIVSITSFCLKTHPPLRVPVLKLALNYNMSKLNISSFTHRSVEHSFDIQCKLNFLISLMTFISENVKQN